MVELWRSQEMSLVQLFVQIEAAHETVDALGELGLVQFRDLNPEVNPFQRNFINEVRRAEEMERKLRFFREQLDTVGISKSAPPTIITTDTGIPRPTKLDDLEQKFSDLEGELKQMVNNQETLTRNYNELTEIKHVLLKDGEFFDEDAGAAARKGKEADVEQPLLHRSDEGPSARTEPSKIGRLRFVTGVIARDKLEGFERTLWRALRGNLYVRHAPVEEAIMDPQSGERVDKDVFIVFFQGERAQAKLKKICESYGASVYPCPDTAQERSTLLTEVKTRISDLEVVLSRTEGHRKRILSGISLSVEEWEERVIKEKAIYHMMNMFNYDYKRKCLIGEGWCPKQSIEEIQLTLRTTTERIGALVPSILHVIKTTEQPPTYFKTNKFTHAYQEIVNAYGMARYREVNPAPLTIVTFPFLFAIMFGDVGHGIMVLLFSLVLIKYEKQLNAMQPLNEMLQMVYDGRYVLVLMGVFAIYTGSLYNEFFSVPMNLFGTNWKWINDGPLEDDDCSLPKSTTFVYPWGVDPSWKGAKNELLYYNSFKMKLSIVLGVAQMIVGIIISSMNATYFKRSLNLFFEFIPQMLFMLSLFGYMVFLIFIKWLTNWPSIDHDPPSILNTMINMFLSPGSVESDDQLFTGQAYVQLALVFIALMSVPWMLLPKPLILRRRHRRGFANIESAKAVVEVEAEQHGGGEEEEEFDFGEVFVHQIIHTIEFVLGAVSNTASYLRLWALSLAHSELATVFWTKVMVLTLNLGFYMVFVGFAVWAACTFGVLLVMESLSAFLHALRLHWVEFQNKFYGGDGARFLPFSYERLLRGADDD